MYIAAVDGFSTFVARFFYETIWFAFYGYLFYALCSLYMKIRSQPTNGVIYSSPHEMPVLLPGQVYTTQPQVISGNTYPAQYQPVPVQFQPVSNQYQPAIAIQPGQNIYPPTYVPESTDLPKEKV